MCLLSMASLLAVSNTVQAMVCERQLGALTRVSGAHQMRVIQDLVGQGCELITVRFSERSARLGVTDSVVVLDLVSAQLVRSIARGVDRRDFAWSGVSRSQVMRTNAAVGFTNFNFIGRTSRVSLSPSVRELLP